MLLLKTGVVEHFLLFWEKFVAFGELGASNK